MKQLKPTLRIRDAVNDLLGRNDRTRDAEVGEMYLGDDLLLVRLRRTKIIEGHCETVDRTVDLFDLMDAHQENNR